MGTGKAPEQTAAPSEGLYYWRTSAETSATMMGLIPVNSCQEFLLKLKAFPAGGPRQLLAEEHRAETLSL